MAIYIAISSTLIKNVVDTETYTYKIVWRRVDTKIIPLNTAIETHIYGILSKIL